MKLLYYICFCLCLSQSLNAQEFTLRLEIDNEVLVNEKIKWTKNFKSFFQVKNEINKIHSTLIEKGYLGASVDSIIKNENLVTAFFYCGEKYSWAKISKGNVEEEALSVIGFREKIYYNKLFSTSDIRKLSEKLIGYYENRGYPFVSFKLDSIAIKNNQFSTALHIEKNKFYKIDSILIKGDANTSLAYIYNYIGVEPGDIYNESLLRKVDLRLKEIPFVQVAKVSDIVFTENQANLYLYLSKKKASQFTGIVGVLPDNITSKVVITGDARIRLKNAFSKGEAIDLNWRKLNTSVQDLKINFNYPFLFKSNFGTDLNFKLYKKDSTFLELQRNIGLQYLLKGGNFFKVIYSHNTSDLLTPSMFANVSVLPPFADVATSLYGIGVKSEKLDYRNNPRSGYSLLVEASAGNKKIKKNSRLDATLYDSLTLKSGQYQGLLQVEWYIPIITRHVLKAALNSAFIYNSTLFSNELYRIGGLRTLRGFNEESIFASSYAIGTIEYRFLLDQNSALFCFLDYAYYESNTRTNYLNDQPYGFGAGIFFATNAGVFSLNYALGTQLGNPIELRSSKVHFGFISFF